MPASDDHRKAYETYELRCRIALLEQKIKTLEKMLLAKPDKGEIYFKWINRLNARAQSPG